jgi:hypothetical protein
MHSFSGGIATSPAPDTARRSRRLHYRHPIQSLVYVTLDDGNGGIIRNLSQDGAAIQAVGALRPNQTLRMRFDLLNPRTRVDLQARVTWASTSGQAGVAFLHLSPQVRRQVNDWIFLSLFRGLEQATRVLTPSEPEELILSAPRRPAIRMPAVAAYAPAAAAAPVADSLSLSWWPRPISCSGLAKLADGLVLGSAILLFFCIYLAVAQTLPDWPEAIALAAGVCGFFTSLYWCLCAWLGCGTIGARLAKLALGEGSRTTAREDLPRFR